MVTTVRQVASWAAMVWPDTDGSGLTPNIVAPTTNATAATTSTARNTNTTVTASFTTSRRVRPTGRVSRYRKVPRLASPATASPAITDTATGRNTGSTSASAAAGNSAPLLSTSPRKAGPSPGRGPMPVTFRNTATRVGRPASSPMLTQVRGRRTSLRSSTTSTGSLPRVRGPGVRGPGGGAREREEHVLQRGALDHQLADAHATLDQVVVERLRAGAVELHDQAVALPLPQLGPWQTARQRRHAVLDDQPAAVHDGRSRTDLLDLGEKVAGQEHRGPAGGQPRQQVADVAHALRVEPVGRLVQHQQPGRPQQRGGQAEPLAHPARVGLDRPAPHRIEPHRGKCLADAPPAVGAAAARARRVEQRQVGTAGQVRVEGRPLDERADLREHRAPGARHRLAEQLDAAGGREHQAEQHAHGRGLARAVGAEEAEHVPLVHLEVEVAHGLDPAVALGQPLGADGRSHRTATPSRASWVAMPSSTVNPTVPDSANATPSCSSTIEFSSGVAISLASPHGPRLLGTASRSARVRGESWAGNASAATRSKPCP